MKFQYRFIIPVIVILLISQNQNFFMAYAQIPQDRDKRIQREVDIMEGVLGMLVKNSQAAAMLMDDRINGMYFDGYGILFNIVLANYLSPYQIEKQIYRTTKKSHDSAFSNDSKSIQRDDTFIALEDSIIDLQKVTDLKNALNRFYLDYASSMKSLNPGDMVWIHITLEDIFDFYYLMNPKQAARAPKQLRAAARYSDLLQYRQGKLSSNQIMQKIKITEFAESGATGDIKIIGSIFDAALRKTQRMQLFNLQDATQSLYLDGFGALFLINIMPVGDTFLGDFPLLQWSQVLPEKIEAQFEKKQKERDDSIIKLQNEILELIGQYGHTLKQLKNDEWIIVSLDVDRFFTNISGTTQFIKIRKADLDKFNRDEIDFKGLKKRAKIWQE